MPQVRGLAEGIRKDGVYHRQSPWLGEPPGKSGNLQHPTRTAQTASAVVTALIYKGVKEAEASLNTHTHIPFEP